MRATRSSRSNVRFVGGRIRWWGMCWHQSLWFHAAAKGVLTTRPISFRSGMGFGVARLLHKRRPGPLSPPCIARWLWHVLNVAGLQHSKYGVVFAFVGLTCNGCASLVCEKENILHNRNRPPPAHTIPHESYFSDAKDFLHIQCLNKNGYEPKAATSKATLNMFLCQPATPPQGPFFSELKFWTKMAMNRNGYKQNNNEYVLM